MARMTRIALDFALVSLKTVQPVVSKIWNSAKTALSNTGAKTVVTHPVVETIETKLESFTKALVSTFTKLRDKQYAGELKYLEKEVEEVKRKLEGQKKINSECKSASRAIKPAFGHMWTYAKVEMPPPLTLEFFKTSPQVKNIEKTVSDAVDKFIAGIESQIKEIEAEAARVIREKAAAIKVAEEKKKAEALAKAAAELAARKAQEKAEAAKKLEEAQKKEAMKKKDEPKPEKPKPRAKKNKQAKKKRKKPMPKQNKK